MAHAHVEKEERGKNLGHSELQPGGLFSQGFVSECRCVYANFAAEVLLLHVHEPVTKTLLPFNMFPKYHSWD